MTVIELLMMQREQVFKTQEQTAEGKTVSELDALHREKFSTRRASGSTERLQTGHVSRTAGTRAAAASYT